MSCMAKSRIDESGYGEIVKQVRDEIFEKEITDRTKLIEESMQVMRSSKRTNVGRSKPIGSKRATYHRVK